MIRKSLLFLGLALVFAFGSATADVTRFELAGAVKDQTGSILPGATVTLRNLSTGLVQTTTTNAQGRYVYPPLDPPGDWTLTVEMDGFKVDRREGLKFRANTSPTIDVSLELGSVQESVTVSAEAPVIATRESEINQSVLEQQVENLPNNGRNFLEFVELSGSAVRVGGGSGNFSFNGQGTRMASYMSDGMSMDGREIRTMNGEFGGGNGVGLDTIQEVQIISNAFKAEVGRTGAGAVSVTTKSGTNDFHGGVYTFQRPKSFVADDPETGAERGIDRQQYGVTVGGPIVQDKTHFFFNWESNRIDDEVIVTSVLGPGAFPSQQKNDQLFGKVNHQINQDNRFDVRFNWAKNDQTDGGFGGLNTFERRRNAPGETYNINSSWVSVLGGTKFNELRVRWTKDTVDFFSPLISDSGPESRTPDFSNTPGPAINRAGIGNTGPNPSLPQNLVEKVFQVVDHFSIQKGDHYIKTGFDWIYADRFVTFFSNFVGTYSFSTGTPPVFDPNNPATFPFRYQQNFGNSALNFNDHQVAAFVQDDWSMENGLTLNLGLRWDYDNLYPGDNNNFGPRLGFAWNMDNAGDTVVRGNFGIYYDSLESSLINRESNFGPEGQFSLDLRQGDPLFPAFPARFDSIPPGASSAARDIVYIPIFEGENFPGSIGDTLSRTAPYFINWSVGLERQLRRGWGFSADLVRLQGKNLLMTFDSNAPPFFELGPGRTRTQAEGDALRPFGSPSAVPGPFGVDFGGFRNMYLQFNGGETSYWGFKVGLVKNFDGKSSFQVRYTYGHSYGDTDNFRLSGSHVPGQVEIDADRSYQWGPLVTDVPHLFVTNGIYVFPYDIRVGGAFLVRSGQPYTGLAGFDANGDGFNTGNSFGDRVAGLDRNSFRMDSFVNLDLTLAKTFRWAESQGFEIRFDIFNVFNTANTLNVNDTMGLDPANPAPNFGNKTQWSDPRQFQIALRYMF